MGKIYDHNLPQYKRRREVLPPSARYNGAFYYSQEIVKNIIPNVDTDRAWVTVNVPRYAANHSIVFVHNNLDPSLYDWLKIYDDIVYVCGIPETAERMKYLGRTIYLPLSIDTEYVKQFKVKDKTKDVAFAGRPAKKKRGKLPEGIDLLESMPREALLKKMAEYKQIYAVGRVALEALALGCEVLPYDERFPDVDRWKLLDNLEAAKILQVELDKIDRPERFKAEPEKVEAEPKPEVEKEPAEALAKRKTTPKKKAPAKKKAAPKKKQSKSKNKSKED